MPVDYYAKNPAEARKENCCKSTFHSMICFACGSDVSFCVYKPVQGNRNLAEISRDPRQEQTPGKIPSVKILESRSSSHIGSYQRNKENEVNLVVRKSLYQKKLEYEEARKRIFNEVISRNRKSRNFKKIEKMRMKRKS